MRTLAQTFQLPKIFNRPSYSSANRLFISSGNKSGLAAPLSRTNRTQNWTPFTRSDQKGANAASSLPYPATFTLFFCLMVVLYPTSRFLSDSLLVGSYVGGLFDVNIASFEVSRYESSTSCFLLTKTLTMSAISSIKSLSSKSLDTGLVPNQLQTRRANQTRPTFSEGFKAGNLQDSTSKFYRLVFKTATGVSSTNASTSLYDLTTLAYPRTRLSGLRIDESSRPHCLALLTGVGREAGSVSGSDDLWVGDSCDRFTPALILGTYLSGSNAEAQLWERCNVNAREFSKFTTGNLDSINLSFDKLIDSQNTATHDRTLYKYSLAAPSSYKTSNDLMNLTRRFTKNPLTGDATSRNTWASNILRKHTKAPDYGTFLTPSKLPVRSKALNHLAPTNLYHRMDHLPESWSFYLTRQLFCTQYESYSHIVGYSTEGLIRTKLTTAVDLRVKSYSSKRSDRLKQLFKVKGLGCYVKYAALKAPETGSNDSLKNF